MAAPRVLFSGYFGFGNTGDEAILEASLAQLAELAPEIELSALVAAPEVARRHGARAYARMSPMEIIKGVKNCDLLVSGGGGLLQDSTGINSIIYYLGVCMLAKMMGKRVMYFCQGYGPVRSRLGQKLVRMVTDRVDLITVRDDESAESVRSLPVGRPVFVTADPALLLEPAPAAALAKRLKEEGVFEDLGRLEGPTGRHANVGPLVAVTVRPWPGFKLEEVAGALYEFRRRERARYLLIPFHPELDTEPSLRLQELLEGEAKVLTQEYTPAEIAGVLRCCDMVLGMRLHSLILAAGAGIPVLGLAYDPKVERFCDRAGALSMSIENISEKELVEALTHLLNGRKHQRRQQLQRVEPMRDAARRAVQAAICLACGGQLETAQELLSLD